LAERRTSKDRGKYGGTQRDAASTVIQGESGGKGSTLGWPDEGNWNISPNVDPTDSMCPPTRHNRYSKEAIGEI